MEIIKGRKELRRALEALPSKLRRRAIGKAGNKAATLIVKQAKANAPKDSGALKKNIIKKLWRSRFYAKVYAIGVAHGKVPVNIGGGFGVGRGRSRGGRISITKLDARERRGEDPYYFRWQELGWRHAKTGQSIPAERYLQRAIKQTQAKVISVYGAVIKIEIDKLSKIQSS